MGEGYHILCSLANRSLTLANDFVLICVTLPLALPDTLNLSPRPVVLPL